jgi:hypothetical protein
MYGAWVNLSGLGSLEPLKVRKSKEDDCYWVSEGEWKNDFSFRRKGIDVSDGCITFVANYESVMAFILGVRAAHSVIPVTPLEKDLGDNKSDCYGHG